MLCADQCFDFVLFEFFVVKLRNLGSKTDIMENTTANLRFLILAGGRSRRVGQDKAGLLFRGELQVKRMVYLGQGVFARDQVFVSLRETQDNFSGAPAIIDRFGEIGPFGGILSAFFFHREATWVSAHCDLPFLDEETLETLIAARDPSRAATAFRDPHNGTPLPQLVLWENQHKDTLLQLAKKGVHGIDEILAKVDPQLIEAPDPRKLDTIHSPEDYLEAQRRMILEK